MSVEKNFSINDRVMLPNQLLSPELGVEPKDTASTVAAKAPAAMSLHSVCTEATWVTVQELISDMLIMSLHSSVREFLNDAPSDVCMCIVRKAEILLAYVQNGTAV